MLLGGEGERGVEGGQLQLLQWRVAEEEEEDEEEVEEEEEEKEEVKEGKEWEEGGEGREGGVIDGSTVIETTPKKWGVKGMSSGRSAAMRW